MKDGEFLREAARYFRARDTDGEDKAHWANVANAENCERIAARLELLELALKPFGWFEETLAQQGVAVKANEADPNDTDQAEVICAGNASGYSVLRREHFRTARTLTNGGNR